VTISASLADRVGRLLADSFAEQLARATSKAAMMSLMANRIAWAPVSRAPTRHLKGCR
jgi:hypothetical protein